MSRLYKRKEKKQPAEKAKPEEPVSSSEPEQEKQKTNIELITTENYLINQIEGLHYKVDYLHSMLKEVESQINKIIKLASEETTDLDDR